MSERQPRTRGQTGQQVAQKRAVAASMRRASSMRLLRPCTDRPPARHHLGSATVSRNPARKDEHAHLGCTPEHASLPVPRVLHHLGSTVVQVGRLFCPLEIGKACLSIEHTREGLAGTFGGAVGKARGRFPAREVLQSEVSAALRRKDFARVAPGKRYGILQARLPAVMPASHSKSAAKLSQWHLRVYSIGQELRLGYRARYARSPRA